MQKPSPVWSFFSNNVSPVSFLTILASLPDVVVCLLFHILLLMAINHVFVCCHTLGHISLYDAIDWFFSNAITVFQKYVQDLLLILH